MSFGYVKCNIAFIFLSVCILRDTVSPRATIVPGGAKL
jgi:hypothetical protein